VINYINQGLVDCICQRHSLQLAIPSLKLRCFIDWQLSNNDRNWSVWGNRGDSRCWR